MRQLRNLSVALAIAATSFAAAQQIQVTVDGTPVRFTDVNPTMVNGHVMVPLRGVFEQMGASVRWNEAEHSVIANGGGRDIRLRVNDLVAYVDNNPIHMDAAPIMRMDRVMVPLRFISETMGATVDWNGAERAVVINTGIASANRTYTPPTAYTAPPTAYTPPPARITVPSVTVATLAAGTVIPVKLNGDLGSDSATVGDTFTATIDTKNAADYSGLPSGTIIEGHVNAVKPKTGSAPGVIDLAFDRVKLPNGTTNRIDGSLIGLDDNSVTSSNGRLVAKEGAKKNNVQFVGIGAGAGALLSVITKGNLITDAVIGAALGYLYGQTQTTQYKDVMLKSGTEFGVRLNRDLSFAAQ